MNKKIFLVIGGLGLGGTEKQLFLKAKYLKNKYNLTIIFFYERGELYKDFKKIGVELIDLTNKNKIKLLRYINVFINLWIILKKRKPHIVHFYLPHAYLLGGIFSYFFQKTNFLMSRRSLNFYQNKIPFIRSIEKRILHRKMQKILVNSNAIRKQLIEDECVERSKIEVIYNLIEKKKNTKKKKNKIIKIIFLANLIPYKNHNMIIKVANLLPCKLKYEILLVGKGTKEYVACLKKKVKKLKLENKISFLGQIQNPNYLLDKSDIGILCSNEEGLSNSILEYMNFNLPIVATKVGGNTEMIKNNFNGYLVKTNDYIDFTKKLEKLITDKKMRNRFGNNNLKILKKNFSLKNNLEKYEKIYDKLKS